MFGNIPKGRQEFSFVPAGHEFHRSRFILSDSKSSRGEENLPTRLSAFNMAMQITWAVKGQRLNCCWISLRLASAGAALGEFFQLAEKILLLGVVETLQRQGRGLDVKHEFGHTEENLSDPETGWQS